MSPALLALVVALALVMAYYNGFHDASNAVSTAITTRSLREGTALVMAAILNLLGALLGMLVITVSTQWALQLLGLTRLAETTAADPDLLGWALVAITLVTLGWEVATWWLGMPSSTWHAFYGATLGTSLALGAAAAWDRLAMMLVASVIGPLLAAALSFAVMHGIITLGRHERMRIGHLRFAQTVSAGAVATGHGMNDARLPLAVIVVAAAASGVPTASAVGLMVPVAIAVAVGTLMGGHRIIRTIGRRLTDLSAAQGLAAESSSAATVGAALAGLDVPMSTSHTLASSVVGAGVAQGPRHVRWPVARTMVIIWVATPVVTAVCGAALTGVLLEMF